MSGVQQRLIEGRHVILIHLQTSHADEDWGIRVKNPGKGPLEFARTLVINSKPWSSEQKRLGASGTHTGSDQGYFRYFNSLGFLHSSSLLTLKKIFPKIHFVSLKVGTQGRNWVYLESKKEQRVSSLCGPGTPQSKSCQGWGSTWSEVLPHGIPPGLMSGLVLNLLVRTLCTFPAPFWKHTLETWFMKERDSNLLKFPCLIPHHWENKQKRKRSPTCVYRRQAG